MTENIIDFIPLIIICAIIIVAGIVGGIASTFVENLFEIDTTIKKTAPSTKSHFEKMFLWFWNVLFLIKKYIVQRGLIGVIGAVAANFSFFLVDKINMTNAPENLFFIACLSVLGGAFSKRVLYGVQIEIDKKLNNIKRENKKIEGDVKESIKQSTLSKVLSETTTALKTLNLSDIENALQSIIKIYPNNKTDRLLNIHYGCLYRRKADEIKKTEERIKLYDIAIITLRNFIENIQNSERDINIIEKNIADALYNIACYHTLKIELQPDDKSRLITEITESLTESCNLSHENKLFAVNEEDFKIIKEDDFFKEIVK